MSFSSSSHRAGLLHAAALLCLAAPRPAPSGLVKTGQQLLHEGSVLTLALQGCPGGEQEAQG